MSTANRSAPKPDKREYGYRLRQASDTVTAVDTGADQGGALLYDRYPTTRAVREGAPPGQTGGLLTKGRRFRGTADPAKALRRGDRVRPGQPGRTDKAARSSASAGAPRTQTASDAEGIPSKVLIVAAVGIALLLALGVVNLVASQSQSGSGTAIEQGRGAEEATGPVLASESVQPGTVVHVQAQTDLSVIAVDGSDEVAVRSEVQDCETPRLSGGTTAGTNRLSVTIPCETAMGPFFVEVPSGSEMFVSSGAGQSRLYGDYGPLNATSQSGDVLFWGAVTSDSATGIRLSSREGDVSFEGELSGGSSTAVSLTSDSGAVTANASAAPWLMARSKSGAIDLTVGENVQRVTAESESGGVSVGGDLSNRRVTATSNSGAVDIDPGVGAADAPIERSLRAVSGRGDVVVRP